MKEKNALKWAALILPIAAILALLWQLSSLPNRLERIGRKEKRLAELRDLREASQQQLSVLSRFAAVEEASSLKPLLDKAFPGAYELAAGETRIILSGLQERRIRVSLNDVNYVALSAWLADLSLESSPWHAVRCRLKPSDIAGRGTAELWFSAIEPEQ